MPSQESGLDCEAGGGLMRVLEEREAICQVGAAERRRCKGRWRQGHGRPLRRSAPPVPCSDSPLKKGHFVGLLADSLSVPV